MNTLNNPDHGSPSAQPAAGSARPACVRFDKSGLPESMRRQSKKFSSGKNAGQNWLDWLKEGENESRLREAYATEGMRGVMETLGLKKTQAYELVAHLDLRREKIAKDNLDRARRYGQVLFNKRRRHLREHYGWIPGMNCCFLKSFEKFYQGSVQVGGKSTEKGYVCVSKFPFPAVRNYLKKHGLQYYVTKYEVIPVEKIPDDQVTWLAVRKHRSGPLMKNEQDLEWADEKASKFVIPTPEITEEERSFSSG
ncbi:MAG: hypothetical protein FJY98_00755 [Candidatus Liptonbacteria bacterium]|nr:hypothetical protein [Candidatus Liptonbacteria bacterium]